jgi:hypothetical protein
MTRYIVFCALCITLFVSCIQKKNLIPDDYKSWERTTAEVLKYPIPGHESNYRKIYINETGEKMIETVDSNGVGSYNYPEGTIIVKEIYDSANYTESSKPVSLTCMFKAPSDKDARGGWLWVMKTVPEGKETIVNFSFCVTCHANANESHPYGDKNPNDEFRDYVYFPYKSKSDNVETTPGSSKDSEYSY